MKMDLQSVEEIVDEHKSHLRSINDGVIEVPQNIAIRTAPAFEIRGTQYGQSHVAKKLAHVRNWTEVETQRVILDYALAGANIFNTSPGPMFDFIKSFGLMTQCGLLQEEAELLVRLHGSESTT